MVGSAARWALDVSREVHVGGERYLFLSSQTIRSDISRQQTPPLHLVIAVALAGLPGRILHKVSHSRPSVSFRLHHLDRSPASARKRTARRRRRHHHPPPRPRPPPLCHDLPARVSPWKRPLRPRGPPPPDRPILTTSTPHPPRLTWTHTLVVPPQLQRQGPCPPQQDQRPRPLLAAPQHRACRRRGPRSTAFAPTRFCFPPALQAPSRTWPTDLTAALRL